MLKMLTDDDIGGGLRDPHCGRSQHQSQNKINQELTFKAQIAASGRAK
jgi:hypothetical protein